MTKIAIIGAGFSGLTLAHLLHDKFDVTLFEKARGVSGRMSTRYADAYEFDHGAQYFTVKTPEFAQFIKQFQEQNIVKEWQARFAKIGQDKIVTIDNDISARYVAVPRMNSLAKALAKNKKVHLQTRISELQQNKDKIKIADEEFDYVAITAPAEQVLDLLPSDFVHRELIAERKMQGCFSLMLGLEQDLNLPFDFAEIQDEIIKTISVNSSKPERPSAYSLMVTTQNHWSDLNIEEDLSLSEEKILGKIAEILKVEITAIKYKNLHRWRYANIAAAHNDIKYIFAKDEKIAICGDWLLAGKVENAFLSAYHLAQEFNKI